MNKKRWIAIATVAGLLGTTAAAQATGLIQKVSGVLRSDVTVTIDGEKTSLHPIYVNGQAYLPVREEAAALGYELHYDAKNKTIELKTNGEEEAADYINWMGIVQDVQKLEDGSYRINTIGTGGANWMILTADKDTVVKDAEGKTVPLDELKPGAQIIAQYGPIVAMSYPGQSHAASITVQAQRLIQESAILSVKQTDDGWQVQFGETKDGVAQPSLTLNAGKETHLVDAEGQPLSWSDFKEGDQVRAYYGPIMTKSLPPQSPLFYLVKLTKADALAPAAQQEFRDLAWKQLADESKAHVKTKQEEAAVAIVDAKGAPVLPSTDEQKKKFEELQAAGGKLVTVTYSTDQDELLGPLVVAFDRDSKEFVGYFVRR